MALSYHSTVCKQMLSLFSRLDFEKTAIYIQSARLEIMLFFKSILQNLKINASVAVPMTPSEPKFGSPRSSIW